MTPSARPLAYLDYNAGAPVRPEVAAAVAAVWAQPGNPSAIHAAGRAARRHIDQARGDVAALVGADPAAVVFTSGGTEANALALASHPGLPRMVSAIEHPSVTANAAGATSIPVGPDGRITLDALDRLLAAAGPSLVSVMLANNETGVIQPVAEAARLVHAHGGRLHCDAAQAAGRIAFTIGALGADLVSISAHKMGGPPGVGALVLADPSLPLAPFLLGGEQEQRRRAGTENVPGIVGFGAVAAMAGEDDRDGGGTTAIAALRDRLERDALDRVPAARIIGAGAPRLGNTTCLALPGLDARTQVMALDLAGIAVSAGPACASGRIAASAVLTAMGLAPDIARSAIRVSLGWASTDTDIDRFVAAWSELAGRKGFTVVPTRAA